MIPGSTTHMQTLKSRNLAFILKSPIPSYGRPGWETVSSAWTVDHAEKEKESFSGNRTDWRLWGSPVLFRFGGISFVCLFLKYVFI